MSPGEADPGPETRRLLYHYTDKAGYNSIRAGVFWCFKAGQPPPRDHPIGAYFTTRGPEMTNGKLASLQIPNSKREYVFAFEDSGDLTPLRGRRGLYIVYSPADYLIGRSRQVDHGTRRGSRDASSTPGRIIMLIGGYDINFDVPANMQVNDRILSRMRKLWPNAVFQDTDEDTTHQISSREAFYQCLRSEEFLIYRDQAALEAWDRDGAIPENLDSMVCFLTGRTDEPGLVREVTLVCGELNQEMNRLIEDLRASFLDVAPVRQVGA